MNFPLKVTLTVGALSVLLTLILALSGSTIGPEIRLPLGLLGILAVGGIWSLVIMKNAGLLEHIATGVLLAICLPSFVIYLAVRFGAHYSESLVASVVAILFASAIPALVLRFRHKKGSVI